MFYNATYGLPYKDDTFTEDLDEPNGQTSFLQQEITTGQILTKQQFSHCEKCGEPLRGKNCFVHGQIVLCGNCEAKKAMKERFNNKLNRKKNAIKAVQK